jgi:hypothetical protein
MIDKLQTAVVDYIESDYNRRLRDSTMGYDIPIEYERELAGAQPQAA